METNLRSDDRFVEDEGWHKARDNYSKFIEDNKDRKVLFLELGVGYNTPGIIKVPFMQMTYRFNDAIYVCINKGDNYIPDEIKDKSLVLDEDISKVIGLLK